MEDDEDEMAEIMALGPDPGELELLYALQSAEAASADVLLDNLQVIKDHQEDEEILREATETASRVIEIRQQLELRRSPTNVKH